MIRKFASGVNSFFEGFRLLKKNNSLQALAAVPAVMSLAIFTAGLIVGISYTDEILSFVIKSNFSEYNFFIKSLLYVLSFLLLVFILYFATFFVVSLMAIPVCGSLAQQVLQQSNYLQNSKKNLGENLITFAKMVRVSILKLGFILVISVLLLIGSLVPFISPLALYFSLMILTFDSMDYAMEFDELGLRARFQFLKNHWVEISGFAMCMGVVVAIPLIHFIVLPIAVLGTTSLYQKIQTAKRNQGKV